MSKNSNRGRRKLKKTRAALLSKSPAPRNIFLRDRKWTISSATEAVATDHVEGEREDKNLKEAARLKRIAHQVCF
ncbi:hypothetical protein ABFA07_022416 [Porites harrisoni]